MAIHAYILFLLRSVVFMELIVIIMDASPSNRKEKKTMDASYKSDSILCVCDSVPSLLLLVQGHIWNAHRSAYYLALLHFTGAVIPSLSLILVPPIRY
jgi:hypothetical protein